MRSSNEGCDRPNPKEGIVVDLARYAIEGAIVLWRGVRNRLDWLRASLKRNSEIIIAACTFVLAVVAVLQLHTLVITNEIQNNTLATNKATQRAFVAISQLITEVGQKREAGAIVTTWRFTPEIENSGGSQTQNLVMNFRQNINKIQLDKPPLDPEDPLSLTCSPCEKASFTLGPKAKIRPPTGYWGNSGPKSLNGLEADIRKEVRAVVSGYITYNDIFPDSKRHITKFCYMIRPALKGEVFDINGDAKDWPIQPIISLCPYWNCADDECAEHKRQYEENLKKGAWWQGIDTRP